MVTPELNDDDLPDAVDVQDDRHVDSPASSATRRV
jgi:hypothetical protein